VIETRTLAVGVYGKVDQISVPGHRKEVDWATQNEEPLPKCLVPLEIEGLNQTYPDQRGAINACVALSEKGEMIYLCVEGNTVDTFVIVLFFKGLPYKGKISTY